MALDASFLNTQHYKVQIKGKVEQSREMSSPPYTFKKGAFGFTLDYDRHLYFYLYLILNKMHVVQWLPLYEMNMVIRAKILGVSIISIALIPLGKV